MKLRRPALRYFGGKFRLADWIIPYFPQHTCYVEPFGGAMSVLLCKPPSTLDVYNDKDSDVVTFFRVLRERPDELLRAIHLTPFSRQEYVLSYEGCEDDLERARRFFVRSWQGIGGPRTHDVTGWRFQKNNGRGKTVIDDWIHTEHLHAIVKRLRTVQIENDDWLKMIRRYDAPSTLFYCDPPYPTMTRTRRWREKGYTHEMTEDEHRDLARALSEIQGMAIVSSYPSELYDDLYRGWRIVTKHSRVNSMHAGAKLRTECLYSLITPTKPKTLVAILRRLQKLDPRATKVKDVEHGGVFAVQAVHADVAQAVDGLPCRCVGTHKTRPLYRIELER